ncbi:MAG: hypothetical protein UY21_C0030G0010 [Microgenomates group bacterium GW2011_GWA1_48_10]|uniref:Peptidase A2 domain-containing protein n=1 Tax=Candidatus Gottesmanbacteria bacterium RIFCSPHIGHO2_01_FULL_47_48 TaxID=1798381 RepID=A0A1F6A266_9BACT|nr:MAG: hypothetical protein UY21_C0030G0010 [Microgenomates group bacterium GW2011_GWA1_48_10]OGG18427.1 MAG: hypothetical protein A2721_01415 [Candidatus Gottesmanbacteria bacterium RIFCSPHIGHO2_01_FULL_47_48]
MTVFLPEVFPYQKLRGDFYPIVSAFVNLRADQPKTKTWALVDSGASISIFRPEIAVQLGIKIERGKPIDLEGVGGSIKGYIHELNLQISHKTIKCSVVFSKNYNVSVNLLGRAGFFESFLITFNEPKKQLTLL